jgi:hypothetical protein
LKLSWNKLEQSHQASISLAPNRAHSHLSLDEIEKRCHEGNQENRRFVFYLARVFDVKLSAQPPAQHGNGQSGTIAQHVISDGLFAA